MVTTPRRDQHKRRDWWEFVFQAVGAVSAAATLIVLLINLPQLLPQTSATLTLSNAGTQLVTTNQYEEVTVQPEHYDGPEKMFVLVKSADQDLYYLMQGPISFGVKSEQRKVELGESKQVGDFVVYVVLADATASEKIKHLSDHGGSLPSGARILASASVERVEPTPAPTP